jgi:xanthine dehydrogenase accessory factor
VNEQKIYQEIVALQQEGKSAALATIVESAGSSPRKAGAKMLVLADGTTQGSIGGGRVELETIEAAKEALASGAPRTVSFALSEENGHVCGGKLVVFIEPVTAAPELVIIGAGHVGKALARVGNFAGFKVRIADDRPAYAQSPELLGVVETFAGTPEAALAHFPITESTFVVIATTGFEKDFQAVRLALKTPARYIGVIGSSRKREVLEQTLKEERYGADDISRVVIPVGLAIGAETPEEIAISITAQLIRSRRTHGDARAGDSSGCGKIEADGVLQTDAAAG